MSYLINAFSEQTDRAPATATVRVHWVFGNQIPDAIQIITPGNAATTAVIHGTIQIDKAAKTPIFFDLVVSAPNIVSFSVAPRLVSNGVLTDKMPDDSGELQFWEAFSMQTPNLAVGPQQGTDTSLPLPAPVIQPPSDIGRNHIGVHWTAGHRYDSYFVNITEKALPGQPPHQPLTIHHDDDGDWGFQLVNNLKPAQTYIVQVQGCTERVFGILEDKCHAWSAPVEFTTLPPLQFGVRPPVGSHTAASAQFGVSDQTDVFVIDGSGAVNVLWVFRGNFWNGPARISPEHFAPPGAALVASPQWGVENQTDLFVVDNEGALNVLWVAGGGSWAGPVRISPVGIALAGTNLTTSRQFGLDQTDVFLVDTAGAVNVFWAQGANNWNGPFRISPEGFAPPGAAIVASPQWGVENQTDLFVVDNEGALNVLWVGGDGSWSGPVRISPVGVAPAGAALTAARQGNLNQTNVFLVDNAGAVNVFWVQEGNGWNGPVRISPERFAPAGAALVATPQWGVENQTDLFVIDNEGALSVFWVEGAGNWSGPVRISPVSIAPAGAPVSTSRQFGLDQTDVFLVDNAGTVSVLWVLRRENWNGPAPIHI